MISLYQACDASVVGGGWLAARSLPEKVLAEARVRALVVLVETVVRRYDLGAGFGGGHQLRVYGERGDAVPGAEIIDAFQQILLKSVVGLIRKRIAHWIGH
jgi:hypothetical protein